MLALYDEWSESFEEHIHKDLYSAPFIAFEEICRRIPPACRATTRILDIPAGTGWLGAKLYTEGFRHIDALEPSNGMLKKLNEKRIYTNVFQEIVGNGQCSVPSCTYDLVVSVGGWGNGHIPVSALDELHRVTKNGGLVIFFQCFDIKYATFNYKEELDSHLEELQRKGTWTKVEERVIPFSFKTEEGILLVFRVG